MKFFVPIIGLPEVRFTYEGFHGKIPAVNSTKIMTRANRMIDSQFPAKPRKDVKTAVFVSVCTKEPVIVEEEGD